MTDPIPTCATCGRPHIASRHGTQACAGHRDLDDGSLEPCKNSPVKGSTVCRYHGAAKGTRARAAADRRTGEHEAEVALRRGLAAAYGDQVPDIDPAEAMLQAVSWKHAEVLALRAKVAELEDEARVWGITRVKDGGDDRGTTQQAGANIWWQMLRTAEEQLVKFAAAARAAGCDERRVQLAEAQAGVVVGVIRRILDGLYTALVAAGVAPEVLQSAWQAAISEVVPRELRAAALEGAAA